MQPSPTSAGLVIDTNSLMMIKNYILTSFRNIHKHLSYSLINILGLALGLTACLLLFSWIKHELSYDTFHEKSQRIYRSSLEYSFGGKTARLSVSPTALLPALMSLPETETAVRLYNPSAWNAFVVKNNGASFHEKRFYAADSTFFQVFSFPLAKGNPQTALTQPYSVVLTKAMAMKYFKDEDPIGKTLQVNGTQDYLVTGVVENVPTNSLLQFDFVCSFSSMRAGRTDPSWWSANFQTFVVLKGDTDVKLVQEKIDNVVKNEPATQVSSANDYVRYNFIPLTDIYLKSDFDGEPQIVSNIKYVRIFGAIAVLILVIACINYINLATARATDRAKEVGIRKAVGALRNQLIIQFIGESIIITLIAFCVSIFTANILFPLFNYLTGKNLSGSHLLDPSFLAISFIALVLIAVAAGIYPALAITSFKPVSVLKGNFKSSVSGTWLRKSLVVFQFGISVILIVGTLVIFKQLKYIRENDPGYNRKNTISMALDAQTQSVYESLKTELIRSGVASHVGRGSESPVNIAGGYSVNTGDDSEPGIATSGLLVDEEYIPAMGIELLEGRNFTQQDRERVTRDTVYTFILNEVALNLLHIGANEAIGKKIYIGDRTGEIIGVVRNFHFASLHHSIGPLVIFPEEQQYNKLFIRLADGDVAESLAKVSHIYSHLLTHRPFDYEFLDQQYAGLYMNEQHVSSIFTVFASLAVVIACLGLFGLVSFSTAQKSKEIGIRKIVGATTANIVVLLMKDFAQLVAVAICIGIPVSYFLMDKWLAGFVYRTEIGSAPVMLASVLCITIAMGTVAYQSLKAALTNPGKVLRSE